MIEILRRESANPFEVQHVSDTYQASDGELVVAEDADVELPAPAPGAMVAVRTLGSGSTITASSNVQWSSNVTMQAGAKAVFVSDGQDWYVRNGPVTAIPDSAINRYPLDEGSGSTLNDDVGGETGQLSGGSWVEDSDGIGGWVIDLDGTDDRAELNTESDFGSKMDEEFAVAITVKTDSTVNGDYFMGVVADSGDSWLYLRDREVTSTGAINFSLRDEDQNTIEIDTDATDHYDIGNFVRIFAWKDGTSGSASDLSIYVNGSEVATSVERDESFSNPTDFGTEIGVGARNLRGSFDNHANIIVDEPTFYRAPSTSDMEDDYNRQPWS